MYSNEHMQTRIRANKIHAVIRLQVRDAIRTTNHTITNTIHVRISILLLTMYSISVSDNITYITKLARTPYCSKHNMETIQVLTHSPNSNNCRFRARQFLGNNSVNKSLLNHV